MLDQKLTLNAELRRHFLEGLTAQLGDAGVLHAALKPMTVTGVSPAAHVGRVARAVAGSGHGSQGAGHVEEQLSGWHRQPPSHILPCFLRHCRSPLP